MIFKLFLYESISDKKGFVTFIFLETFPILKKI